MKKEFYSNGKLLVTGEYVVLDGALALAIPTKFGQTMKVAPTTGNVIHWKSYDADGSFKGDVITLHKNIAPTIIFLVVIRIFWRYTHPAPKLSDSMSP